jgi:hypothetical protein
MSAPRILVITPTLGTSPWLGETVESVARLGLAGEHVLVAPAAVVAEVQGRFPLTRVVAEPGGGMYAAINAGLRAGKDWDAFTYINDDDLLLPGFARVAAKLGNPIERRVIYGGVRLIDKKGRRLGAIPISPVPALNRLLYAQWIEPVYQHGTLVSRAVVESGGGYDESFRYCGDSEFLGRACLAGVTFVHATSRPVAAFRLRAGQLTKHLEAMQAEHRRMEQKIPLRAAQRGWRHLGAKLVFRAANVPVYLERIARFGFIGFGEVLARGE